MEPHGIAVKLVDGFAVKNRINHSCHKRMVMMPFPTPKKTNSFQTKILIHLHPIHHLVLQILLAHP
jgi:hypothetical protein